MCFSCVRTEKPVHSIQYTIFTFYLMLTRPTATAVAATIAAAAAASTKLAKRKLPSSVALASPATPAAGSTVQRAATPLVSTPSGAPGSSWLAARLLESGIDVLMVRDCEQKLVVQEGFVNETDFAECPPAMFTHAYLTNIGVTGMGLQRLLLKLQGELHAAIGAKGKTDMTAAGAGGIAMGNTKQGTAAKKMRTK